MTKDDKKPAEENLPTAEPAANDPTVAPMQITLDKTNVAQGLGLLGKRNIDK